MSSTQVMANAAQAFMESMTPKFAVSYLRVSTRGQAERGGGHDEGFSIPAQREANKNKAQSLGAFVGKEFVDRGTSAKSADRPQLQAMLEYVKENRDRVDYVIVHKIDRLARNREDDAEISKVLRECGVQLVSTSESIDETPSGMLLHGIMSSIAEFYSRNLATEVKKGMNEKVKGGGTVGRAPLGYRNVRTVDEKGREERTVVIDEERAPLVKMAFEEYASGDWTVMSLAEYLSACGLYTRPTPRIASRPIAFQTLAKMLANPYYIGIVTYKGVQYPGAHEPLVDDETFERVQTILATKINGERNFRHPHFLKSTVYCGDCGSRMIVTNVKKKNGNVYSYFCCGGKHRKQCPDCQTRHALIPEVERRVEQLYDIIQFPHEVRVAIEEELQEVIKKEKAKYDTEMEGLLGQKRKLEHKREKLLEAHYNDAIPLDLLKKEQAQITKELAAISNEIRQHDVTFEQISQNLSESLDLLDDCASFYRNASDTIKRLMNQAIFDKIYISYPRGETTMDLEAKFKPPFNILVEPFQEELTKINRMARQSADTTVKQIQAAKNRILNTFRYGLAACDEHTHIESCPTPNFFTLESCNKAFLVEMTGIEPVSESIFTGISPSAVSDL